MTVSAGPKTRRLPGVDGFWVFIGADSVIFALLFFAFMQDRYANPSTFEASSQTLDFDLGGMATLLLITSSWFAALAVQTVRRDEVVRASWLLLGGVLTGLMFVISKLVEYSKKIATGITPATDAFFMWYFVLTGIHLVHVLVGTSLLTYVWTRTRRRVYGSGNRTVLECVTSFWHLVDLLWIVLFPLLYLMR